jgi:serine/threonine protein kinase
MLREARGPSGELVILKAVRRTNEVAIHKALYAISSRFNHTIALLRDLAFDSWIIIVLPKAIPLEEVINPFNCETLSKQFLEGVMFMQQQLIAHLDIKPANIVVDPASCRLCIVDFGISLKMRGRDDVVTGYRGTRGWVAPEVGSDDQPNETFSPICADLWACGKVLEWFLEQWTDNSSKLFVDLARQLMSHEPASRPCLPLPINFDTFFGHQKRKALQSSAYLERKRVCRGKHFHICATSAGLA